MMFAAFASTPVMAENTYDAVTGGTVSFEKYLVFDADRPMVLHGDGEYLGDEKHIEMRVLRNILNVMI